ncbi:uncharacterized protein PHACADRAFT_263955 [Phanerochaete carnosa HHB-10118-sp]|uniref:Uncharacterized protein n=1 Tax=Phanerochaete carnosa (strain HHB-10118-sp) TaxID=650164 RepID=K5VVI2_PHACS|nr:uncharacterized protein PHACADRAFT_263955 [Phanerochaete carnosa HHB-10118-sp]EKM50589.1 hypothetical protein PHACADRAFT_263955 [Phanerochaete carnosa HHB-10118-sp]
MEDAMVTWSSLSYNDTVKSPHFDVSPDEGPIVPSTIFSHIAFKPLHRGGIIDPSQEELAYLRPVDQDLRQTPPSETLDDHPIALRTFASFPPIETINVDSPFEIVRMLNRRGLVAKDVCRSLAMHMEQKVYSDSLKDSLHYLGLEVSRAFPWDLTTIEECVRQLQDWFKIVRWVGFEYQRPQRNRWFVLKFEPRELPKSEREIVGLFCSGVGT